MPIQNENQLGDVAFRTVATVILSSTAILKLLTLLVTRPPFLAAIDPLFRVENAVLMSVAAIAELLTCCVVMSNMTPELRGRALIVVSVPMVLYHLIFELGGMSQGCPCLGGIETLLKISRQTTTSIAQVLAVSLLLAGIGMVMVGNNRRAGDVSS